MSELSDWQRYIYEPEVANYKRKLASSHAEIERLRADRDELLAASRAVLDGLLARIDAADPKAVPVFAGIADLHDAVQRLSGSKE